MELSYEADSWLSAMLGRPAFKLQLGKGSGSPAPVGSFAYGRIPTQHSSELSSLAKIGFQVVDTNVLFEALSLAIVPSRNEKIIAVRKATQSDQEVVAFLARNVFRFSRFHLDPGIPEETADRIKQEWARNFFLGKRGEHMLVAESNSRIVGFLQLLQPRPHEIVIDLIGVDAEFQGQGVAQQLIGAVSRLCGQYQKIFVGTQIANTPSIRLYEKLGFRLKESHYMIHAHF